MPALTAALLVLLLQRWWMVRTSNSPRIKRSFPYPRRFKPSFGLYQRPHRRSRGQRLVVTARARLSSPGRPL